MATLYAHGADDGCTGYNNHLFYKGNGLDFAALAMVPAAVVVCVGSWCLILNLFTATWILG